MTANPSSNYSIHCDPKTKLCTAKLKVSIGRAYSISEERRAPWVSERVKAAGSEYLGYGFKIDTRAVDEARRIVPFVASTPVVDRYGDIIEQEGWVLDFYKRNPVGLLNHDSRALPIAKAVTCGIVNGNLCATMQFATRDVYEVADTVFKLILGGYLNAMSVGFIPLEYKFRYEEDEEGNPKPWPIGRIYSKSELLENSIVTVPANPEALVDGRSFDFESVKSVTVGPEFRAAFKAIEVAESDDLPVEIPNVEFEVSERAYFVCGDRTVRRYGSTNPVDTKVVDADPYLIVGRSTGNIDCYKKLNVGSIKSAKANAFDFFLKHNETLEDAFLSELVGADVDGDPVYRSLYQISKKENSRLNENKSMCSCQDSNKTATSGNTTEKSVVPFHSYPLAPNDAAWDASKEMGSTDKPADWKKMSTIILDDGKNKGDYKLPHHKGPGGKFATVRRGVANALARANQVKGASASDKAGAKKHLQKHMAEFKRKNGKAYDEAFWRCFEALEEFRDTAADDRVEAITRALVGYILDPDSKDALDLVAAADSKSYEKFERAFTNAKMNGKLKMAHKSVMAAMEELDGVHKDMMPEMKAVKDLMQAVMQSGSNSDPNGDDEYGIGESVSAKLTEAYESSKDIHSTVKRAKDRFATHMRSALDCLEALCDYVEPPEEEDEEDDQPNEGRPDQGEGQPADKQDDPTYTQDPNAEADGQVPPGADGNNGGDADKVFELATQMVAGASKEVENKMGPVPSSTAGPTARSDNEIEFESLLDLVSEGTKQASKS